MCAAYLRSGLLAPFVIEGSPSLLGIGTHVQQFGRCYFRSHDALYDGREDTFLLHFQVERFADAGATGPALRAAAEGVTKLFRTPLHPLTVPVSAR